MKVVALDLDGTLEDSRVDMVAAVQRVRASVGLDPRPDDDFVTHVNRGMPHLYQICFAEYFQHDEAARLADVRRRYTEDYSAHIADHTRLYPGIRSALEQLRSDHVLAVVTNKPETLSTRLLSALGVRDLFSAVIGGDTCDRGKPAPTPLAEAVRRCGGSPDRTVMVGDSAGDIRCGHGLGVPVIWCAWGYAADVGDLVPDSIARRPEQLPELVHGLVQ